LAGNEKLLGKNEYRLIHRTLKQVSKIQREKKIDLIHAHVTYPGGYLASLASREFNIPYIISEHMGPFPFEQYREKVFYNDKIAVPLEKAKKVIAVSSALQKEIESWTGIKAAVIPNVVNENEFQPVNKAGNGDFNFIMVGNLYPVKGVDLLLRAIRATLDKGFSKIHCRIIGEGYLESELKELARELKIQDMISWEGGKKPSEIAGYINQGDCLVCSSRHESFGVALVEALACGIPVLATNCGGPSDIVNERNGILVEKENVEELAAGMISMLQESKRFSGMEIRKDFLEKYSVPVIARKYNQLYLAVAGSQ
jgi:glycosyltransferase involved in cell wall biosynthesis